MNSMDTARYGFRLAKNENGEITAFCGDTPVYPVIHTIDPYDHLPWEESIHRAYQDGVRIFSYLFPLVIAWDNPDKLDFTLLDDLEEKVLAQAPEALLMPRVFMTTPHWWDEKYPDELLKLEHAPFRIETYGHEDQPLWKYEAKMYHDTVNPSFASMQWRKDAAHVLESYVRRAMALRPGKYFCFQIAYGTCGEWGPFGTYLKGRFCNHDFSTPMIRAFRQFLKAKYTTNENLAHAWKIPGATFDDAMPLTKLEKLQTDLCTLKDPRRHQRLLDWADCATQVHKDAAQAFCQAVKRAATAPVLTCLFGGANLQAGASAYRAHFILDRMNFLDIPEADAISYPNWYENRARGIAAQGPTATIAKSKLFIAECDARGMMPANAKFRPQVFPINPEQEVLSVYRDTFFNLTSGQGALWWYDFGTGWYQHDAIRKLMRAVTKLQANTTHSGNRKADIAVVIDIDSMRLAEGDVGHLKQFRTLVNESIPESGFPYDVIDLKDIFNENPYKLYIFRDLLFCPNALRRRLRAFLTRNAASAIWFHAAGTLSNAGIRIQDAWKLTGIHIAQAKTVTANAVTLLAQDHPLTRNITIPCACGDTGDIRTLISPVLFADDPNATVIGQLESIERPGIAVIQNSDRFDLWSASPLLTPQFIANAAELAGCTRNCQTGIATYGAGTRRAFWTRTNTTLLTQWPGQHNRLTDIVSQKIYTRKNDGFFHIPLKKNVPLLLEITQK